jgi:photosystem II stability/assembly factor-like uncharacterized protein
MEPRKSLLIWSVMGAASLVLISCSLLGGVPVTVTATAAATSPAIHSSPVPTETLAGPALSHFAAGQKISITYIRMVSGMAGWGIGGQAGASDHVFRSQDAGETWHDVTPLETAPSSGGQTQATGYFQDATTGWVVYAPGKGAPVPKSVRIWSTHDGGATWQYSSLDTSALPEYFDPSTMLFIDGQHGWILAHLGGGMNYDFVAIVRTEDGGATWNIANDPNNDAAGLHSCTKTGMAFIDPQNGWLSLDCRGNDPLPHLFRTSDGGTTWQRVDLAAPAGVPDLFSTYACGLYTPVLSSAASGVFPMRCLDNATSKVEQDYLYWTSDAGKSWQTAAYPGGDLLFYGQQGLALGHTISGSGDGGRTWTKKLTVSWNGQFSFIDAQQGWAVATNQGAIALVKTTDGGGSWEQLHPLIAP